MATVQHSDARDDDLIANQQGKLTSSQKQKLFRYYASGLLLQLILLGALAGMGLYGVVNQAQQRGDPFNPALLIVPLIFLSPFLYSLTLFVVGIAAGKVKFREGTFSYKTRESTTTSYSLMVITDDKGKQHKYQYDSETKTQGFKGSKRVRLYYVWLINKALKVVDVP